MIFYLGYVTSIIFHLVSLYYGLRGLCHGQYIFMKSKPKDFFKSHIERKFWVIALGLCGNILFVFVKPFYIIEMHANAVGWLEPYFIWAHILTGLAMAIWHYMSFGEVQRLVIESDNEEA